MPHRNQQQWEEEFNKLQQQEQKARQALLKEIDHLNTKLEIEQNVTKYQFTRLRYSRTVFEVQLKAKMQIEKILLPYRLEIFCISGWFLVNGIEYKETAIFSTPPNDALAIFAMKDTHLIIKVNADKFKSPIR